MAAYSLRIETNLKPIRRGHLALGGSNPDGETIAVNNFYIEVNGQPFIPISGEFQYGRYPHTHWKDELQKMAAGGINLVATYCFWIRHEPLEGQFDWDGDQNLRCFVALCGEVGLPLILRIGPFAHGECRNGGLPDWLYGQPFEVRSNHPAYLALVRRYYEQIAAQVQDLLYGQGGPVIAIQIENEYMHAGAPWETYPPERGLEYLPAGDEGAEHLVILKQMAVEAGLDVPLYTCTAWGGAPVPENDFLPVFGGYAFPTWADRPAPSDLYTFRDLSDTLAEAVGEARRDSYPIALAEMQGGIQVRYGNRPQVAPESIEAFALMCSANGANWLGYYVYHGGINPMMDDYGLGPFTHERLHPRRSYDFQAPLGDCGLPKRSYHLLRRYHSFLRTWQAALAPMRLHLPDDPVSCPQDTANLRYAARSDGKGGFLFLNNYQDHVQMASHEDLRLAIELPDETITIPSRGGLTLLPGSYAVMPFNLEMDGLLLKYATVQPLARLEYDGQVHYFFFAPDGVLAEYVFTSESVSACSLSSPSGERYLEIHPKPGALETCELTALSGTPICLTTLTAQEAACAYQGEAWEQERLLLLEGDANLIFEAGGVTIFQRGSEPAQLTIIPPLSDDILLSFPDVELIREAGYSRIVFPPLDIDIPLAVEMLPGNKLFLTLPDGALDDVHEFYITPVYEGDMAEAYLNGHLVHDHFYNGLPWTLALKDFTPELYEHGLVLRFYPIRRGEMVKTAMGMASDVRFSGESYLNIQSVQSQAECCWHL